MAAKTYARCTNLENESRQIAEHERHCIDATLTRSNDEIAQIASTPVPNGSTALRMQSVLNDRDRQLSKCKAAADREEHELSVCQRAEYENRANAERDRQELMTILTISLSH